MFAETLRSPLQPATRSPFEVRTGSGSGASETFRLLDELGDFLTDENGDRLTAPE